MPKSVEIATHPTPWQSVILVCRKCSKKLHGGFGPDGDETLTRELKRALRAGGQRGTTRVIETKCLGLCPKGGVTVLPASTPATLLTVPAGTAAATLLATLQPAVAPSPPQSAVPDAGS